MLQYIVFLGAAVNLVGAMSYIRDTLKGKIMPNRVTWLLWAAAPTIATAAAISKGVGWSVLPVFMSGFVPFLVFVCSFVNPKSYWKLQKLDFFCGLLSVLALILWMLTKEANVAILFAIASDGLAAVPTLVKSWKYPQTESPVAFSTGLFNSLTSFFAVKFWSFSELAFPVYLIIVNTTLIFTILAQRKFKKVL